jgi:NADH-quinone oxidoreductase subunit J
MTDIFFYLFAAIALISAVMVILARNPVRSVLSLIVTFLSTAVIWLLLGAEFLAVTLVLVYVGAVMVLFLFVVMILDIDFATLRAQLTKWVPLGIGLSLTLFVMLLTIIDRDAHLQMPIAVTQQLSVAVSNVAMLGELIFTHYLLQFEIAGIILLVAIVAAIGLIYRGPRDRKVQNIAQQIAVKATDRVRLVDGV